MEHAELNVFSSAMIQPLTLDIAIIVMKEAPFFLYEYLLQAQELKGLYSLRNSVPQHTFF